MSEAIKLRFEGYSDDTFGEYGVTNDDYDNSASGKPIYSHHGDENELAGLMALITALVGVVEDQVRSGACCVGMLCSCVVEALLCCVHDVNAWKGVHVLDMAQRQQQAHL